MEERADNSIVSTDARNDVVMYAPNQTYAAPPGPVSQQPPNLFRLVHSTLRGRYPIVIALCVVFTIVGGVVGYLSASPMYRAEALIRIYPKLPTLVFDNVNQDSTTGPMFNSYVNSQVALLHNARTISSAVNSEAWRKLGRGNQPSDVDDFRKSFRAATTRETPDLISLSFTDKEAIASKVGVEQVMKAYEEIFVAADGRPLDTLRRTTLENLRRQASDRIAVLREEIKKEASEYGTEDLTQYHEMYLQEVINIEQRILNLRFVIAERSGSGAGGDEQPVEHLPANATPEQIGAVDDLMSSYLSQQRRLEGELASLKSQGFGAGHPSLVKANSDLDSLVGIINGYAKQWNDTREIRPAAGNDTTGAGLTVAQLQSKLTGLVTEAERTTDLAVKIGNKRMAIEAKQREIADQTLKVTDYSRRQEQNDVESKVAQAIARIEFHPPELPPSSPTVDPRKKYAVLGAGFGGSLIFGLAFLVGLVDKRCRYSDEVNQESDGKLLACLPVMARTTDQEEALAAVHSLHRVRAQMQIVSAEHRTIAITSANAGDGKTSLSLSLGISFAGVGHRTILIDLDLIGHGLSSRLRMCDGRGVVDALATGTIDGFVRTSHVAGLFILPVGSGVDASPAKLRRSEIEAVIRSAAASYDTVLIDTGPLLGSLEANFVCAASDATLLVIGRGQSRALVRRAIHHLRDINARLLGVVFNRARNQDFRSTSVSASFRSVRTSPSNPHPTGKGSSRSGGIDPLADAVFVDAQSYENGSPSNKKDASAPAA